MPAVSSLVGTRDQCHGRKFFHRLGGVGWGWDSLEMIQVHYIYYGLNFSYYYIAIYNKIMIEFIMMQNQWEP